MIRELPGVHHIPTLAKYLISISKTHVKIVFEKDTCNMVRGTLVLMQGVHIGTLYKLLSSPNIDGCKIYVVTKGGVENLVVFGENMMLWHQRLGHIG